MSLSIKYIPFHTKDIDREVHFFTKYFDLEYSGRIKFNAAVEGVLLKLYANKELYLLLIPQEAGKESVLPADDPNYRIIINTNDCLKEYIDMREGGIEFEERPKYLPSGLGACFKVGEGARYLLLEERNYDQPFI